MAPRPFRFTALGLALLFLTPACSRTPVAGEGGGAELMRNLLRARTLEIVAEERALTDPLERAAARLRAADESVRFDAFVSEGYPERSRRHPRIVVGTRASNRAFVLVARTGVLSNRAEAQRAGATGAESLRDGARPSFTCAGETYSDPRDAVVATFADPDRPGLPVTVVFANSTAAAALLTTSLLPAWEPWMRVYSAGRLVREGPLFPDGSSRPGEAAHYARALAARDAAAVPVSASPAGLTLRATASVAPSVLTRYADACRAARERVLAWSGARADAEPCLLVVWGSAHEYLAGGDPNALSSFDPLAARTDALILGPCDDGGAGVARATAWAALGPPAEPWMSDAAGTEAAWVWWGRSLGAWIVPVLDVYGQPQLLQLIASDATERVSHHLISPVRAALWRFLGEKHGPLFQRELWRGTRQWVPDRAEAAAFVEWLVLLGADNPPRSQPRRDEARRLDLSQSFLSGIGTCDFATLLGGATARGYGSYAFDEMLGTVRELGADALLVTAFARDEPGLPRRFGDAVRRELAPREGDVRIVSALLSGSARGLHTMLAPQLLSGDGGTWSGTWTRSGERDWSEFFERYAHFVGHHAALAEIAGASVLSIGSRLAEVSSSETVGRRPNPPEAEWKLKGWKRVIQLARALFAGNLTYSAGSPEELEKVPFFTDLDCVGLELSPTLDLDDMRDGLSARNEITRNIDFSLDALERTMRATKKPGMITQVTFSPALDGAARVLGSSHTSVDWQAQQYLDLGERLKVWRGTPQLAGLFAWRFGAETDEPEYSTLIDTERVRAAVRVLFDSVQRR